LGCYLFLHFRLSLMRFLWVGRRDETDGNWEVFCFWLLLFLVCCYFANLTEQMAGGDVSEGEWK
jgi:hypothetical protein